MEVTQHLDKDLEVYHYNPKRNAATFDWKVSLMKSPIWSESTTTSSVSGSPELDKDNIDEEEIIDQLYQTRIDESKFTAMRLLTKESICVYCGVHVDNNEIWNQKVCSLCSDALDKAQPNHKQHKRHGIQFMALQPDQCRACRQPVNDTCIEALGYRWHPHHFTCTHCHSSITEYIENEGMPYCERDYLNLFGLHCERCSLPIIEDHIAALDTTYHVDCFTCQVCPVPTPACHSLNKKLVCESHYYSHHQLICQICEDPIKSKYLASNSSKFHPYHFNCHSCKNPLDDDMRIKNDTLFCSHCICNPYNL